MFGMRRLFPLLLFLLCFSVGLRSVENAEQNSTQSSILRKLSTNDPILGRVRLDQDEWIEKQLQPNSQRKTRGRMRGYRIQVFSGNDPAMAKSTAMERQRFVAKYDPTLSTYVTYKSPFWRVRVGNYRDVDEAETAIVKLRRAFPSFRLDMHIVPDEVFIDPEKAELLDD